MLKTIEPLNPFKEIMHMTLTKIVMYIYAQYYKWEEKVSILKRERTLNH